MSGNSAQLKLIGNQPSTLSVEVEEELARGCKSRHHALIKSYEASNLEPKPFYMQLGMDQATFSRVYSGKAFPDPELFFPWMKAAGNLIPLRYDAWKSRHELVPVRTDAEEQIDSLKQENAELRRALQLLGEAMRGGR